MRCNVDFFRNVLTSQEVVDFVSQRLEKQSDSDTVSLSKICEEVIIVLGRKANLSPF